MVSLSSTIPNELKVRMDKFSWVNWSELAREEFIAKEQRVNLFKKLEELTKGSKLTDEDIMVLSKKVRKGRFKELKGIV